MGQHSKPEGTQRGHQDRLQGCSFFPSFSLTLLDEQSKSKFYWIKNTANLFFLPFTIKLADKQKMKTKEGFLFMELKNKKNKTKLFLICIQE